MYSLYDFTNDEIINMPLGGTVKKHPVLHNGSMYVIKYQYLNHNGNHINSVTSEYIGSHVAASAGLDVQQVVLGTRNDEAVSASRDFRSEDEDFIGFDEYVRHFYGRNINSSNISIEIIYQVIDEDELIPEDLKMRTKERFWDMFIIDTLLANPYRALDDWGYIVKMDSSGLRPAPIFDFGGSLLPLLSDEKMNDFLNSNFRKETFILKCFPKISIKSNDKRTDLLGILASEYQADCTAALKRILPRIDMKKISGILDDTPMIFEVRRDFLKKYIAEREELIYSKMS
jgi:hypothetical protein